MCYSLEQCVLHQQQIAMGKASIQIPSRYILQFKSEFLQHTFFKYILYEWCVFGMNYYQDVGICLFCIDNSICFSLISENHFFFSKLVIQMEQCAPRKLNVFLKSLQAKIELLKSEKGGTPVNRYETVFLLFHLTLQFNVWAVQTINAVFQEYVSLRPAKHI